MGVAAAVRRSAATVASSCAANHAVRVSSCAYHTAHDTTHQQDRRQPFRVVHKGAYAANHVQLSGDIEKTGGRHAGAVICSGADLVIGVQEFVNAAFHYEVSEELRIRRL